MWSITDALKRLLLCPALRYAARRNLKLGSSIRRILSFISGVFSSNSYGSSPRRIRSRPVSGTDIRIGHCVMPPFHLCCLSIHIKHSSDKDHWQLPFLQRTIKLAYWFPWNISFSNTSLQIARASNRALLFWSVSSVLSRYRSNTSPGYKSPYIPSGDCLFFN